MRRLAGDRVLQMLRPAACSYGFTECDVDSVLRKIQWCFLVFLMGLKSLQGATTHTLFYPISVHQKLVQIKTPSTVFTKCASCDLDESPKRKVSQSWGAVNENTLGMLLVGLILVRTGRAFRLMRVHQDEDTPSLHRKGITSTLIWIETAPGLLHWRLTPWLCTASDISDPCFLFRNLTSLLKMISGWWASSSLWLAPLWCWF